MLHPKIFRLIGITSTLGTLAILIGLGYFVLTGPDFPYRYSIFQVDQVINRKNAGALQPGDVIITVNGRPSLDCWHFTDSPAYDAPRGVPIPITYWRSATGSPGLFELLLASSMPWSLWPSDAPTLPGAWLPSDGVKGSTQITLANQSPDSLLGWGLIFLNIFCFALAGSIVLLGGAADGRHLLLGLMLLSSSLILAAGQGMGHGETPLSLFLWASLPIWGLLSVLAHAVLPINQLRRPITLGLIACVSLIGLINFVSFIMGATWFGCYQSRTWLWLAIVTYFLSLGLPIFSALYLLRSAYRLTANPFSRLQIRAIGWAYGLGLGLPILLFTLPIILNLQSVAPFDIILLLSGIVPITYLFVFYRGELLSIDRYLNRLVFTFLFLVFWVIVTLAMVKGILSVQPRLNPATVALTVALLSLLISTFTREQMGMLVDLALYGVHYDYETVVSHLGQSLAGAQNETRFAQVVIRQLPQALSIRYAALWLAQADGQLRLVDRSSADPLRASLPALPAAAFPPGSAEVEVYNLPFHVGSDLTPWQAILRLYADTRLVGIILLGIKFRENTYSQRDARTLQTLAGWIATTASNLAHLAEQQRQTEREHRLMLALAENEERLMMGVAHELHDRGISALGMVRLMVEQERARAIVSAGLEQVIANLRELSDNQLSPQGLSQGLPQALEAMLETQRQLGLPVSLEVDRSYTDGEPPSTLVSRELFYIAQEATVNALKHASPSRVEISLSRPDGKVQLRIHNDGRAFDVAPALVGREAHGMGIMQARANRIGGRLTITSTPATGTEVTVSIDPDSL